MSLDTTAADVPKAESAQGIDDKENADPAATVGENVASTGEQEDKGKNKSDKGKGRADDDFVPVHGGFLMTTRIFATDIVIGLF